MSAPPLFDVIKVIPLDDYKLLLIFDNNEKKMVNLEEQIKEISNTRFGKLKDREYFKTVLVNEELGTIVWDNGYDICPHLLYQMGERKDADEISSAL